MKATHLAALLLPALLLALPGPQTPTAAAQQAVAPQEEPGDPGERVRAKAEELADETAVKVQEFAGYADSYFEQATARPFMGWVFIVIAGGIGVLSLCFGWTLVRSLLVPCAPVLGLATGGVTAFCVIEALFTNQESWFKLTLLGLGATMGVALYLFSALRAKPIAAFLVILSPFLILAAFLFPFSEALGLLTFVVGFAAGFAAMVNVRPLSIIATSMLGATAFWTVWGLLSHLMAQGQFIRNSFIWLAENPLMLALGWGAIVFVGCSFQFATSPRGTLQH